MMIEFSNMSDNYNERILSLCRSLVTHSVALGMSLSAKIRSPKSDFVSVSRAICYLGDVGYSSPRKLLENYIDTGRIKYHGYSGKKTVSISELNAVIVEDTIKNMAIWKISD